MFDEYPDIVQHPNEPHCTIATFLHRIAFTVLHASLYIERVWAFLICGKLARSFDNQLIFCLFAPHICILIGIFDKYFGENSFHLNILFATRIIRSSDEQKK